MSTIDRAPSTINHQPPAPSKMRAVIRMVVAKRSMNSVSFCGRKPVCLFNQIAMKRCQHEPWLTCMNPSCWQVQSSPRTSTFLYRHTFKNVHVNPYTITMLKSNPKPKSVLWREGVGASLVVGRLGSVLQNRVMDSGLVCSTDFSFITSTLGGVPREQKMLKGHLPGVIYHQVY